MRACPAVSTRCRSRVRCVCALEALPGNRAVAAERSVGGCRARGEAVQRQKNGRSGGRSWGPATARATQRRGRRGRQLLPSRWHCQLQCARASPRVPRGLQAIERRAAAAANHAAIERPSIALPRALFTLSASITLKGSAPDGTRTLCLLHSRATLSIHTREWPRPRVSICIPPS